MQSINERRNRKEIVDVCYHNLIKGVRCDQPCSEGYGAENLISNSIIEKNKGFLAERFIKPPVTVSFEFCCNINIRYVIICCKVGAQKTTGLEIFCQSSTTCDQFDSVGSGILGDNKSGFVFHRHNENTNHLLQDQYLFRTFKSSHSLSSTQGVLLKIFRTNGTTVPALGKVEIWGIPCDSHLTKITLQKNILSIKDESMNNIKAKPHKTSINNPLSSFDSFRHSDLKRNNLNHNAPLDIPEDFIDPITCEIMTLPIILPSGKIVDNTTLESYIRVEEQWGRSPSDPFTGIPFTDSRKPISAVDLKVRLDKYLSENCTNPNIMNVPRCLGRNFPSQSSKTNVSTARVSKLIGNNMYSKETARTNNHVINKQANTFEQIDGKTKNFSLKNDKVLQCKRKQSLFEGNMEDSLDLALKSTLSKLPKLTENKSDSDQLPVICHICKSLENLFIIPCSHYICRICLVNSKVKDLRTCKICQALYRSSNVEKVHL